MTTAAILFAIAAVGGVVMAAMRLGGRDLPPLPLAVVHGLVATAGAATLIFTVTRNVVPGLALVSLGGFVVAALGGLVMFGLYHLKRRALPIPLMAVHATVALVSFIVLLVVIFRR